MGRPMGVIVKEMEDAKATFEGGDAASAWAFAWAKEEQEASGAGKATAGSSPSTPRRRLAKAKQLDQELSG